MCGEMRNRPQTWRMPRPDKQRGSDREKTDSVLDKIAVKNWKWSVFVERMVFGKKILFNFDAHYLGDTWLGEKLVKRND
jgi:hypothetical protein